MHQSNASGYFPIQMLNYFTSKAPSNLNFPVLYFSWFWTVFPQTSFIHVLKMIIMHQSNASGYFPIEMFNQFYC